MRKLTRFKKNIEDASIVGGTLLAKLAYDNIHMVTDFLKNTNISFAHSETIIGITTFVIIIRVIKFTFTYLLEYFTSKKSIRKRILGTQFIEGVWLEHVIHNEIGEIFTIAEINFDEDKYSFKGANYFRDGSQHSTFRSDVVAVQMNVMIYKTTRDTKDGTKEGYGRMQFKITSSKPPTEFDGFFDLGDGTGRHMVEAKKMTDNDIRSLARDRAFVFKSNFGSFASNKF